MPYVVAAVCQLAAELHLERMTGVVVHHDVHDLASAPDLESDLRRIVQPTLHIERRLCESHIPEDDFSQREECEDAPRQPDSQYAPVPRNTGRKVRHRITKSWISDQFST